MPSKTSSELPSSRSRSTVVLRRLAVVGIVLVIPAWLAADWWSSYPAETVRTYVGRQQCLQCHQTEFHRWEGSYHDRAMDPATSDTVLGDFNDATLVHHGVESRMYRRGEQFWINTEGPDGSPSDFQIKYVFGVAPLQQYLVELEPSTNRTSEEEGRLQVLRVSWDTINQRWFYLAPPDVPEKLAPSDPLHWTGQAQNWNHMCANCHSTNVDKGFDVASKTYHTTFSELDVSCEACHGPASLHVELASAKSVFWDRLNGYGLKPLKASNNTPQIESCAPCHSRRSQIGVCNGMSPRFTDCFEPELLRPETYYPDGQIRDEVYVYGSFLQSKMYHKGIRCTDCHDPHSTKLLHEGNQVCTSCHQHPAAKYDTPAHHNHPQNSTGASCVECHMPATPFMDVDLRRDHSLRIPRPDLSVAYQTPNACTGCHLDKKQISPKKAEPLNYYADWLQAARDGDQEIANELSRLDKWAAETVVKWYGDKPRPHFAHALAKSWRGEPGAIDELAKVASDREAADIVRASVLWELWLQAPEVARPLAIRLLSDRDPLVRAIALRCLEGLPAKELIKYAAPRLSDSVRLVRHEAANVMAPVDRSRLSVDDQRAFAQALNELQEGLQVNRDLAGAHLTLGVLAERLGQDRKAAEAYQTAIHVQPTVTGPRSNLAQLMERMNNSAAAQMLRAQELQLLARDVKLAPNHAGLQYRYGLSLYLNGQPEAAIEPLRRACELEPSNADFHLTLGLLYEHLQRWPQAIEEVETAVQLRPQDAELPPIVQRLRQAAAPDASTEDKTEDKTGS